LLFPGRGADRIFCVHRVIRGAAPCTPCRLFTASSRRRQLLVRASGGRT